MVVPGVPHAQPTANDHILLWAHHRVTTQVRIYRPRIRPRKRAPGCENCKANVRWDRREGTNVKRNEKSRQTGRRKITKDKVRTWKGSGLGLEQGTEWCIINCEVSQSASSANGEDGGNGEEAGVACRDGVL